MSAPILPLAVWQSGTNENSLPANDNALRVEALSRPCLGVANTPPTTDDGDVYIVGSAPSGAFATFDENDIAIYRVADPGPGGTWIAWRPVNGLPLIVAAVRKVFEADSGVGAWVDDPSVGGGGGGGFAPVVTESGTSLTATAADAGDYTRFTNAGAKTYTFDDGEGYSVGDEYHGRNVGAGLLTIAVAGTMTVNAPAGGTLSIPQDGTFTVKIVASDEADLFGNTEAAP